MSIRFLITFVTMTAAFAACDLPPQAPSAPPAPEPPPRVALPPPPKCESLAEMCAATPGKRIRISSSVLAFEPVEGWIYARGEGLTVARSADGESWLGVAGYDAGDTKNPREESAQRSAKVEAIGQELGVTLPRKKVSWKKANAVEEAGNFDVSLWEIEGAARGGKQGSLLLFAAPVLEGRALVGMVFVPGHGEASADEMILKSIRSISLDGARR